MRVNIYVNIRTKQFTTLFTSKSLFNIQWSGKTLRVTAIPSIYIQESNL